MNEQNRGPYPHHAEQAVLAGLMLDPNRWDDVTSRVSAVDFCSQRHRDIFEAMKLSVHRKQPTDVISVTETLRELGKLEEIGGKDYLSELTDSYVTAINIEAYASIVHEASILRSLLQASGEITQSVYQTEGRDATQLLDFAEAKVFSIKNQYRNNEREGLLHIKPAVADAIDYLQKVAENGGGLTGVSTGFKDLDLLTTGLQGGDLIIVAGRPSMGKTTFAMNIAENIAISTQLAVGVFSLEMSRRQLVLRMMSSLGQIDQGVLKIGKFESTLERARLQVAVNTLKDAPLFIDDGSNLTASDLRARARRLKSEVGQLGLIVVDYLQLMQLSGGQNDNRASLIGDISRSLKLLAKELNVPVLALSQLSRAVETRVNRRPVMSDLRESGAIEQDADVIMFVYRDEVYNPDTPDKGVGEIIIAKQRNGPLGTVRMSFEGKYLRFSNLTADYGESVQHGLDE